MGGRAEAVSAGDRSVEDPVSAAVSSLVRQLAPGDRLPAERELAATLNVSRSALRDRLSQLEGLGVLERRTGSGTYVRELESANLTSALDLAVSASRLSLAALHSVRVALERQAAREAARLGEPVPIAYMRKAVKTMEESTASDPDISQADLSFHRALFNAAANPALSFFADALRGVLKEDLAKRRERMRVLPDDRQVMIDVHLAIYDAVQSGDEQAAMQAIDHHFDVIDQRLLAASAEAH
ncbi:FadR/GntR family transcriptional regulator [Nocardia abscessus]|uniref:FadR/GntR family transcriptional regulator n=1 Tax=Nocardia abscessus TaxID=120957 RepID=UPI0024580D72|nr:FCD domain-containing protein [Nocardia abscessus]